MASAYGPAFAEEFGNFFPLITKYYVRYSITLALLAGAYP